MRRQDSAECGVVRQCGAEEVCSGDIERIDKLELTRSIQHEMLGLDVNATPPRHCRTTFRVNLLHSGQQLHDGCVASAFEIGRSMDRWQPAIGRVSLTELDKLLIGQLDHVQRRYACGSTGATEFDVCRLLLTQGKGRFPYGSGIVVPCRLP